MLLATLMLAAAVVCRADETVLGPVQELKVLDDFGPASTNVWKAHSSDNLRFEMTAQSVPGVSDSLLQINFTRKEDGKPALFTLKRALPAGSIGSEARGLRIVLGAPQGKEWWMQLSVHVGGKSYAYTMQTTFPDRATVELDIPFEKFMNGHTPLDSATARQVDSVSLLVAAGNGAIYLDQLSTYTQQAYHSWLSFASSHDGNNLFQPNETVTVTLTPGGTAPAAAKGFRYSVEDFFEHVVQQGHVTLDGAKSYTLNLTPKTDGFYELRAWWTDSSGKDLEDRSCLRCGGTEPQGIATFSVLPRTREQSRALMQRAGRNAFFGMHTDYMDLDDAIGATWRMAYTQWAWVEPTTRPDRSQDGIAPWAKKLLAEPPAPAYEMHVLPFVGQSAPSWARNPDPNAVPAYASWDDYAAMVRDQVRVEMHRYPQMHPRIYGAAWEVNLNMPPINFTPHYTPADVVELYKRQRETIKTVDPDAMIMGPCPSTLDTAWFEEIFKAGVLQYLDAIETHGYAQGVATPEENDYPGKLAAIRALMEKYNHGKVLPIFVTEATFRGVRGTQIIYREQAELVTRLAIILKGEGVRVFFPFFSIDYDRDNWYGFQFNLEVDEHPFSTNHVSPKPSVNAMAVCIGELEGAKPLRRVTDLGKDVWAYDFDRNGTLVTAVWTQAGAKQVTLDVGSQKPVTVVDIMGHARSLPAENGKITLTADTAVQYVEHGDSINPK